MDRKICDGKVLAVVCAQEFRVPRANLFDLYSAVTANALKLFAYLTLGPPQDSQELALDD